MLDKCPGRCYTIIRKGKEIPNPRKEHQMYSKDYFEAHSAEYEEMLDWILFEQDMAAGDPWED